MLSIRKKPVVIVALSAAVAVLSGCGALDRLGEVSEAPRMTNPQDPTARPNYRPVSLPMPPPTPVPARRGPNSLWRMGSRAFFKDQRAALVGDILTIVVDLEDEATLNNRSQRARTTEENAAANAFLGYETALHQILPEAIQNTNLVDVDSTSNSNGNGQIERDEDIELKVAAVITQILPNGNLVLHGRQELRVNYEIREVEVAGIIRPEDIKSDNTIAYEKIAEARIAYGGRGHISDVQQPRLATQVYDTLFPF